MDSKGQDELRTILENVYFPSWYHGIDPKELAESDEGKRALENHIYRKLDYDRYDFVPWISSQIPLHGARVLEIGCGTGCSTVSLAEQGANKVTSIDVHKEGLEVAKTRCRLHKLENVQFILGNAKDIEEIVKEETFDLIVFFEVLEHMTIEERISSLSGAWNILDNEKHLCVTKTPSRLWYFDGHTSQLPFFNWLPDKLALKYSKYSSLEPI